MQKQIVRGLTGVILSSPQPERLANFYSEKLGIPMQLNQHGNTPSHWECDFNGIHYAVLKSREHAPNENVVLSFAVEDIHAFAEANDIQLSKTMDLGEGAKIANFLDPDGNTLRLWELK